ncbi:hypothetical protein DL546_002335 [Coniochaeta pulveracea]|uniref:Uncharacterized protein n=1 Tax=Coniochaeta pulveracea TaxID=177199 RepID=A0A420Y070_9PEZI|nr:hypothetical protein DL546_002335 [Coniochaeta pulveracea]
MPATRSLTSTLGRIRTPLQTRLPQTPLVLQQVRNTTGKGTNDGDLGGPGGQESYPESKPIHRRHAAVTALGVLTVGGGIVYMIGGPTKAAKKAGNAE